MATHALAVSIGGDLPLLQQAEEEELVGSQAIGELLLRVRHDLALALAAAGKRREAVRLVEKVRAESGGYRLWKQRADATWHRIVNGTGVAALTRQERKIAALARAGHSNRRIAEEESLTVRTVEFHLSGVYRKLGIAGRRELMTFFSRI
ncbi:helix-turn-helix transcriptional regulator [Fodinicola feengrottensis]|uniref:helix-turn-helix transcriptional regulator n=1 Tax=Fodinicola feengrottensis TaxID=435914 RepID=UPI002441D28F|nr:helix-turn-helix transcriptional regulator [Fodinicola feengrottensis]